MKNAGLLSKLQLLLLQQNLITICKPFETLSLDYEDVIYDQHLNEYYFNGIESVQYNVALPASEGLSQEIWN